MLVLTTASLHNMFGRYMQGRLHPGLEIELIVVHSEMQAEADRIKDLASGEACRFPPLGKAKRRFDLDLVVGARDSLQLRDEVARKGQ
jgi:hypothetical protein